LTLTHPSPSRGGRGGEGVINFSKQYYKLKPDKEVVYEKNNEWK
jgi:hypothetical protein